MILWAGIRSDEVGMVVEHYPRVIIPQRKFETQTVPGRNGDIILSEGAFQNYEQPYQVFLDEKENGGLETAMPRIIDWLLGHEGYHRLEDSYFPDFYRMAHYTGGTEFISVFNEYGEGTLTFNCAPEKYYKYGEQEIGIGFEQVLSNPSLFPAKPIIRISGSGACHFYFTYEDGTVHWMYISELGGTVTIDIKNHTAYNGSTVWTDKITGQFEDIVLKGKTKIHWTENVSSFRITPRWWTI